MAKPTTIAVPPPPTAEPAAYLDMPDDRRQAAKAHVANLSATIAKLAVGLPLGADVDDFRRVLMAEAERNRPKGGKA